MIDLVLKPVSHLRPEIIRVLFSVYILVQYALNKDFYTASFRKYTIQYNPYL